MKTTTTIFVPLLLTLALLGHGQTFGPITRVITDSSGSGSAGASVAVTNPQTNFTRESTLPDQLCFLQVARFVKHHWIRERPRAAVAAVRLRPAVRIRIRASAVQPARLDGHSDSGNGSVRTDHHHPERHAHARVAVQPEADLRINATRANGRQ